MIEEINLNRSKVLVEVSFRSQEVLVVAKIEAKFFGRSKVPFEASFRSKHATPPPGGIQVGRRIENAAH